MLPKGKKRKNQQGYYQSVDSLGRRTWRKTVESAVADIDENLRQAHLDYANTIDALQDARYDLDRLDIPEDQKDQIYSLQVSEYLEHAKKIRGVARELISQRDTLLYNEDQDLEQWAEKYQKFAREAGLDQDTSPEYDQYSPDLFGRYSKYHYKEEDDKKVQEHYEQVKVNYQAQQQKAEGNYREKVEGQGANYEEEFDDEKREQWDQEREAFERNQRRGRTPRDRAPIDYKTHSILRRLLPDALSGIRFRPFQFGRFRIYFGKDSLIDRFPFIVPSSIGMRTIGGLNSILWSQKYKPQLISSANTGAGVWFQTKRKTKGSNDRDGYDFDDQYPDDYDTHERRRPVGGILGFFNRAKEAFSPREDESRQQRINDIYKAQFGEEYTPVAERRSRYQTLENEREKLTSEARLRTRAQVADLSAHYKDVEKDPSLKEKEREQKLQEIRKEAEELQRKTQDRINKINDAAYSQMSDLDETYRAQDLDREYIKRKVKRDDKKAYHRLKKEEARRRRIEREHAREQARLDRLKAYGDQERAWWEFDE